MSDKSPKSKRRSQKQKDSAKAKVAIRAKSKQDRQGGAPQVPAKGQK